MYNALEYYKETGFNKKYLSAFKSDNFFGPFMPGKEQILKSAAKMADSKTYLFDEENEYRINRNGFRGEDFIYNAEILSAGCSVTFGIGIPENAMWSKILEKETKKTVNNISYPGGSVAHISNLIVRYCMLYGNPKKIFFFAPSLTRGFVVSDEYFYISGMWENNNQNGIFLKSSDANISFIPEKNELFFVKNPKYPKNAVENSISPHQFIYESLQSLFMLESFCITNNIDLIWTTWSNTSIYLLRQLAQVKDFYIKKYVEFEEIKETMYDYNDLVLNCKETHNSEFINEKSWSSGTDIVIKDNKKDKNYHGHPGIHFHHHVSDFFKKFIV